MAKLDKVLDGLDERRVAQEIELRVEMAREKFPLRFPAVRSNAEVETLVAEFYQYLMSDTWPSFQVRERRGPRSTVKQNGLDVI